MGWLVGLGILLVGFFLLYIWIGAQNPIRCTFWSLSLGGASLLAVNLTGTITGIVLPLSLFHLAVSFAGGPAGVALLVLLQEWIV